MDNNQGSSSHRRIVVTALLSLVLLAASSFAVAAPASVPPTNAVLRPLGDGVFQLGGVRLNKRERSVTFPASANITAELTIEYALVHKIGKTHESIFRTDAKAQDIHLAMLLLGAKPALTNTFPADLSLPPPGDKVEIEVTWTNKGTTIRRRMEDLILNRETGKSLSKGPWYYNGSNFSEGMFTAQRDGSIISIHVDPDALINNPRPGRDNDDLHLPNTALLPEPGSSAEVTIRLLPAH